MTTLAADKRRPLELGDINAIGVIASDIIYEGAAVGDDGNGYARPLVAADPFLGFAESKADNAAGAAGDKTVRVFRSGRIQLAVTSAAITDVGRPVYAADDDTFALKGGGTKIGRVHHYVSSGVAVVDFDADRPEEESIVSIPVVLSKLSNADVVTNYTPGFAGRVKKAVFAVTDPATTGAKAASLNLEIGVTDLTGGVVALTSANCTPLGALVAGTAVTDGNAFKRGDNLSVEASAVTAFVEGQGVLLLTLGK